MSIESRPRPIRPDSVNLILSMGASMPGSEAAEAAANMLGETVDDIIALTRYPIPAYGAV